MTPPLTFSLSPIESPDHHLQSHFFSSPYLIDNNFYGWTNQKPQEFFKEEAQILTTTTSMADSQTQIPKLEDFLGDFSSSSSLTQIYDPRHQIGAAVTVAGGGGGITGFFSDHEDFKTIACFQSETVDESSASFDRRHISGGHVTTEVAFHGENSKKKMMTVSKKKETSDESKKKIVETFGQRTSIYRGVTRHRWTGRYEAHLWDNSCRKEGQVRKGRQVYLGGYDKEDKAARAYDLAALKYWGPSATTNFPVSSYLKELEEMNHMTKLEFIASLRRKSSGFSRGASIYRGVTRHHQQGRWQSRIGRVAGNKDLYLGTFATEEEAAEAYDIAAIKFRGINAVTNFEMNRYDVETILKSSFSVGAGGGGGTTKRHKLAIESSSPSSADLNPNSIPCAIPIESSSVLYHQNQNFFQHYPVVSTTVQVPMNQAEFFLWP